MMIRGSLLVALVLVAGGDDMGFPRGRLSSTRDAVNRRLLTAGQEGRYAPPAFVRPATMDAAATAFNGTPSTTDAPPSLLRLKGVNRTETFTGAEVIALVVSPPQVLTVCVVLCEYEEDGEGVRIVEVARVIATQEITTGANTIITAEFPVPVTLDVSKKYAAGVAFSVPLFGAGLVGAPVTATAAIRFPTFSMFGPRINTRWDGVNGSEVEWVERGAGAIHDRPLVTLVQDSPTERWY